MGRAPRWYPRRKEREKSTVSKRKNCGWRKQVFFDRVFLSPTQLLCGQGPVNSPLPVLEKKRLHGQGPRATRSPGQLQTTGPFPGRGGACRSRFG